MRRKKRQLLYLLLAIISLIATMIVIFFVSPHQALFLGPLTIPPVTIFFIPLVVFLFSLPTFLLKSYKHGILLSLFVVFYFIFRLSGLTHPIFFVILLGIFLALELFFSNRQPR